MFLLNIHSNQNPSFFPVKMQQHRTIPFVVIVVKINNNNFDILFRMILPLKRETEIQITKFVYPFQALNLNSIDYLRFTNCYGKASKKCISWHNEI